MRRAGQFTQRVLAVAVLVAAASSGRPFVGALTAQVIKGTVRDQGTHAPLQGVTVAVVDQGNTTVRVAITSITGQFSASMSTAGAYALQLRRIGYVELTTTPAALRLGDTVVVAIDLAATPVTLDTVRTQDRPDGDFLTRVTPGHEVFAKHYALGKGIFVDGAALERSGLSLTDYLGHESGVRRSATRPAGTPVVPGANGEFLVSNLKGQCLYARVDHWSLVHLLVTNFAANIDQLVPPSEIMAVEFYRELSEVPEEWRADSDLAELWSRSYSLTFGYNGACGNDRYDLGSTDLVETRQIIRLDTAYACRLPQRQGYAAAPQAAPTMPTCGFMQVWSKRSW